MAVLAQSRDGSSSPAFEEAERLPQCPETHVRHCGVLCVGVQGFPTRRDVEAVWRLGLMFSIMFEVQLQGGKQLEKKVRFELCSVDENTPKRHRHVYQLTI